MPKAFQPSEVRSKLNRCQSGWEQNYTLKRAFAYIGTITCQPDAPKVQKRTVYLLLRIHVMEIHAIAHQARICRVRL
jgi:hypothetical protein